MSSESNSSVSVKLGIVLAVFLGLVGGLIFAYNFVPRPAADQQTGKDIAAATSVFVRDGLEKDGKVYSVKQCDANGCEVQALPNTIPSHAWRMLAFAGMLQAGDGSAKDALAAEFEGFERQADLYLEHFSLHQVYEAYEATNDNRYLMRFIESAAALSDRASADWTSRNMPAPAPMLAGAVIRELGQLHKVLGDADAVAAARQSLEWFPKDDSIVTFMRDKALKTASDLAEIIPDDGAERCFEPWGKYALYESTNDEKWLNEIKAFFQGNADQVKHFTVAQYVLPCLDVLHDLGTKDSKYDSMFKEIAESTILKGWDSAVDKKCNGDNGFLALSVDPGALPRGCKNAQKFLVDSAWATYIFSKRKDLFEVL